MGLRMDHLKNIFFHANALKMCLLHAKPFCLLYPLIRRLRKSHPSPGTYVQTSFLLTAGVCASHAMELPSSTQPDSSDGHLVFLGLGSKMTTSDSYLLVFVPVSPSMWES